MDGRSVLETIRAARPWGLAAIVATTVSHCLLSACKWRLVTRWTSPESDLGGGFYFYMALISLLGQILPVQLTQVAGRGIALRMHRNVPLIRGAGGAAYDQLFDVAVPGAMLVPVVLVCIGGVSVPAAGGIAMAFVLAVGCALALGGGSLVALARRRRGRIGAVAARLDSLMTPRRISLLYGLSVARFLNLSLRAWLIGWALQLDISWMFVLFASCGATFSLLLGFVPGAIGVLEWGWVGMFHALGVPVSSAATYAIGSRVLNLAALVALNLVHAAMLFPWWWRARGGVKR